MSGRERKREKPVYSVNVFADLQVTVNPDTVTEGERVTLTCRTTCNLSGSPTFIWYKNRSPLSFTNQIHQFSSSSEDRGTYSCAVKGNEQLTSPAVALNVRCEYKRPVLHYMSSS